MYYVVWAESARSPRGVWMNKLLSFEILLSNACLTTHFSGLLNPRAFRCLLNDLTEMLLLQRML